MQRPPSRLWSHALALLAAVIASPASATAEPPHPARVAVSLSYDDALVSQLDNAVPALNRHGFKASFYIFPAADGFADNLERWAALAEQGHELGNHTLYHVCAGNDERTWVRPFQDLKLRTVEAMRQEIQLANTFLQALDGQTERTLTPPCLDTEASDGNYVNAVRDQFIAIKGQGVAKGTEVLHFPTAITGEQLIALVTEVDPGVEVISLLFHGVGGGHSAVSTEAHAQLLEHLAQHPERYRVDSYINIMRPQAQPAPLGPSSESAGL